jgi:hypothetical protein
MCTVNKTQDVQLIFPCLCHVCSFLCSHTNRGVRSSSTKVVSGMHRSEVLSVWQNLAKRRLGVWCMEIAAFISVGWCTVVQLPYSCCWGCRGQVSIVGLVTCCELGVSGFEPRWGQDILSSTHPSSRLYNGYQGPFPGVKRLGRGVDRPPPSSTKVKNESFLSLSCLDH